MASKEGVIRRKRQSRNQRVSQFVKIFVSPKEKKMIQKLADKCDKSDSGFCADLLLPIVRSLAQKEEERDASAANAAQ